MSTVDSTQRVGESARNKLDAFIRVWVDASRTELLDPFGVKPTADAVAEECGRMPKFKLPGWIASWNEQLLLCLQQKRPPERVLCGFNANVDLDFNVDPDHFVEWVASQQEGQTADLVRAAANDHKIVQHCRDALAAEKAKDEVKAKEYKQQANTALKDGVKTLVDMVSFLIAATLQPDLEWKPMLRPELWPRVREYVQALRSMAGLDTPVRARMGGASANMAYVLSLLDVDTTCHWLYHAKELADDSPRPERFLDNGARVGLKRLDLGRHKIDDSQFAATYGKCTVESGEPPPDPSRVSFGFNFNGSTLFDRSVGSAGKEGRVLFLTAVHQSEQERPSESLILRTKTPTGEVINAEVDLRVLQDSPPVLGPYDWPFIPAFAWKYMEGKALVIELANDDVMEEVAKRYDYFLLGGVQLLNTRLFQLQTIVAMDPSKPKDREPGEPTVRTVVKHALCRQFSKLAQQGVVIHWEIGGIDKPWLLDDLAEIAKGRIKSASLNHTELMGITAGPRFEHTRFYYRSTDPSKIEIVDRYDRAAHLALALDVDELYVHGNDVDLIVRRRTTRGALRQEIASTLYAKGIVLLTLLERSVPDWEEQLHKEKVKPLLTAPGFITLLKLAEELAKKAFPRDKDNQQRKFLDIAYSGYAFNPDPEKYSVIAVPVMWPDLKKTRFSTVGAGDTSSAVVAVYSGK